MMKITQWVNMLINKGEVFERLALQPLITQLVEYQLGPDFLLSCCDAQIKHPGAGAMPLHTDQWWMPPPADPSDPYAQPAAIIRNQGRSLNPVALQSLITPPAGTIRRVVIDHEHLRFLQIGVLDD